MRDKDFHDYIVNDAMLGIVGISSKQMFGGYGIYKNGKIFAIIAEGKLYFKVGDQNRIDFKKAGSKPFTYKTKKKENVLLSYFELPADILEDRNELEKWIEKSLSITK